VRCIGVAVGDLDEGSDRGPVIPERDRRHDDRRIVSDKVDLRVGVPVNADDAKVPVFCKCGIQVAGELVAVLGADIEQQLVVIARPRQLGDCVDDTTRRSLAVQHGCRALQDLDLLERVHVRAGVVVEAEQHLLAVTVLGRVKAADLREVAARRESERVADDACGEVERIVDSQRAARAEFFFVDDRDGAGRFEYRCRRAGCTESGELAGDDDLLDRFVDTLRATGIRPGRLCTYAGRENCGCQGQQ